MADCNDLFKGFHDDAISVPTSKEEYLKQARDAIRERIRKYFRDTKEERCPKFYQQGSFALKTQVAPIDGEYDVDDGVYLQNLEPEKDKWPKTETVHDWICCGVESHTSQKPINKKNCVRVVYAGDYHVDLPIYSKYNDEFYLARLGDNQWIRSDPKSFRDWFVGEVKEKGEQLRRNVRYMKAWSDYGDLVFTGMMLTVLCGKYHVNSERDDESLVSTAQAIANAITIERALHNPVDPTEDLLSGWGEDKIDGLVSTFEKLHRKGQEAIEKISKEEASKIWIGLFGDRFPYYQDKKRESDLSDATKTISIESPVRPWA